VRFSSAQTPSNRRFAGAHLSWLEKPEGRIRRKPVFTPVYQTNAETGLGITGNIVLEYDFKVRERTVTIPNRACRPADKAKGVTMVVLRKAIVAALLLTIVGGAFAISETEVKQNAQTTLQQAKQQSSQNDSDFQDRNTLSEGNTANAKFTLLKHRLEAQAAVVEREKSRIDTILTAGRTAKPEELSRYEKAIAEYAKRIKELEDWIAAN
jgi:hypothetical protein